MAKRVKVLRARKPQDQFREESLLLRSAESLGRVIGALQRQLDDAARRLSKESSNPRAKPKRKSAAKKRARKPRR